MNQPLIKPVYKVDFAAIRGQESVKRALTVALCGNHGFVLIGPTGCGKSMLIEASVCIIKAIKSESIISYHEITTHPHDVSKPSKLNPRLDKAARLPCDIHIEVPAVPFQDLFGKPGTDSAYVVKKILQHRDFAYSIGTERRDLNSNLNDNCKLLLKQAYSEIGLNARSVFAIVRVARTIASMDGSETIEPHHLAEAIQYRLFDRKF